ncbi:hypothetical protein ACGFSG_26395 [Streptomyces sp. NPDC048512]|uniref:hypothetical protein n=1 Tax=unclassified Streptomyces TaxID=2593676 RepID=UPI0009BEBECE|nr:hypothetical protein [Streptomyces sp. M41(2017)]OQQ13748.1 hypothetical protein B0675_26200 [Streptomyces sp. M41(2017)]
MKISTMTAKEDAAARARGAAPLGVGLALVSLLASGAVPAAAHSQPASAMAGRVTLTNADNGRTVSVQTGDDIEVRLTGYRENGLTYSWGMPVSDSAVIQRTAGAASPRGDVTARFHVDETGTASISAPNQCRPSGGVICPVVGPWTVRVEAN